MYYVIQEKLFRTDDTLVQIVSVKNMLNEIRFWIIKGKIAKANHVT